MMDGNRQKWLIAAAVLCAGGLLLDRAVLPPLTASWNARSERIAEVKELLDDGELLLEREASIRERWDEMTARALPADRAAAENTVLNAVDQWAAESRLAVSSLKPRWMRTEGIFARLEVRATAEGRPEAVLAFLYALERDRLPLCVESAKLTPRDDRGRLLGLDVTFTALARGEGEA